jgi:hypothetical protein
VPAVGEHGRTRPVEYRTVVVVQFPETLPTDVEDPCLNLVKQHMYRVVDLFGGAVDTQQKRNEPAACLDRHDIAVGRIVRDLDKRDVVFERELSEFYGVGTATVFVRALLRMLHRLPDRSEKPAVDAIELGTRKGLTFPPL